MAADVCRCVSMVFHAITGFLFFYIYISNLYPPKISVTETAFL